MHCLGTISMWMWMLLSSDVIHIHEVMDFVNNCSWIFIGKNLDCIRSVSYYYFTVQQNSLRWWGWSLFGLDQARDCLDNNSLLTTLFWASIQDFDVSSSGCSTSSACAKFRDHSSFFQTWRLNDSSCCQRASFGTQHFDFQVLNIIFQFFLFRFY